MSCRNSDVMSFRDSVDGVRAASISRRNFLMISASTTFMAGLAPVIGAGRAQAATEYITTPEAHGWSSGGSPEANVRALQAAIANASAKASTSSTGRGVVELTPGKTYVVRVANGRQDRPTGAANFTSSTPNVEMRTRGKPTSASSKAVIQAAPWANQIEMHNRVLALFDNCRNCRLTHVRLDGSKFTIGSGSDLTSALSKINHGQGGNGNLCNIIILGSSNCRLEHVESYDALTDGLQLTAKKYTRTVPVGLLVANCDFHHNRRQGLQICGAGNPRTYDNVVFRRCSFRYTGDETWNGTFLRGQKPGANVDIESSSALVIRGVTFDACLFDNAKGSTYNNGAVQSSSDGLGCDCNVMEQSQGEYMKWVNCTFSNNRRQGLYLKIRYRGRTFSGVRIENNTWARNGDNGGRNELRFSADAGAQGLGRLLDTRVANNNVYGIRLMTSLATSGHGMTVQKGVYKPVVVTNGYTSVRVS